MASVQGHQREDGVKTTLWMREEKERGWGLDHSLDEGGEIHSYIMKYDIPIHSYSTLLPPNHHSLH